LLDIRLDNDGFKAENNENLVSQIPQIEDIVPSINREHKNQEPSSQKVVKRKNHDSTETTEIIIKKKKHDTSQINFFVGEWVEAKDRDLWYVAKIIHVDREENKAKVHFHYWNRRYDKFCDIVELRPCNQINITRSNKGKH
jgi:hypothetical protein